MGKVEVKSNNQGGGITAQNVNLQGHNFLSSKEPESKKKKYIKIFAIISATVAFIAAVIKILEYFKIQPFK